MTGEIVAKNALDVRTTQSRLATAVSTGFMIAGVVVAIFIGSQVDPYGNTLHAIFFVIAGAICGVFAGLPFVMRMDAEHQRRLKAAQHAEAEANLERQRQYWRDRQAAIASATTALEDMVDQDTLQDEEGEHCWPEDLFKELFEIPEVVVPYTTSDGWKEEIRFWSQSYIGTQATDPRYIKHKARVAADRERWRKEEENRTRQEDAERAEEEERRRRLDAMVAVPLEELIKRKLVRPD